MSRSKLMAVAAAAALLAGACQSDDGVQPIEPDETGVETPEPVEDEDPEPEPEPEDDDPFAIPDEIDVDYAQRIFDELFAVIGDASRLTYDELDEVEFAPTDALDLLRTVSADEEYFARLSGALQRSVDSGFEGQRVPIEDRSFIVQELSRASEDCIVAEGEVDFRVTAEDPPQDVVRHSYAIVADDGNVTGWAIQDSTAVLDDFEPLDPEEVCP